MQTEIAWNLGEKHDRHIYNIEVEVDRMSNLIPSQFIAQININKLPNFHLLDRLCYTQNIL